MPSEIRTQCIIGMLGSPKTSILNAIREAITANGNANIVWENRTSPKYVLRSTTAPTAPIDSQGC